MLAVRPGIRCILLLAVLYSLPLTAAEAVRDDTFPAVTQKAREIFLDLMESEELVGGNLALVYQNGQRWSYGTGLASRENNIPFDAETTNALHELAKLFTAVGVMQLAEQGQVDIDRPFSDYVSGFSPFGGAAAGQNFSLRQLLSHHSGLPTYYAPGFRLGESDAGDAQASDSGYRDTLGYGEDIALVVAPGQVYEYSYLGYTLLGILIEQVSGLSYRDYIRRNILEPLEMHNTHFGGAGEASTTYSAAFRRGREEEQREFRDIPANGLISTAEDMSRFVLALLNGGQGIIQPSTLQQMFSPQNSNVAEDENLRIGLGFFISPVTGGQFQNIDSISHAADIGKSQAYFIAVPQYGMGVLLSTNTIVTSTRVREAADRILAMMIESARGEGLAQYTPHAERESDPDRARSLVGSYSGVSGRYSVELDGNTLKLKVPAFPFFNITLLPREDDFYGLSVRLFGLLRLRALSFIEELERSLEVRAVRLDDGNYLYWYWRGVAALTFSELAPAIQDADWQAWEQRSGEYRWPGSQEVLTLSVDRNSGHLKFGEQLGLFELDEPPQIYCVVSGDVLRRCGRGLEPPETRNLLRATAGGLKDAYGREYTLMP